jgi:L-gulonate 3-dehydrogenase
MLFASSGFDVALYDIVSENVDKALVDIKAQLLNLELKGLLRGQTSASEQFSLIRKAETLEDCVRDAIHVQVLFAENTIFYSFIYESKTKNDSFEFIFQ